MTTTIDIQVLDATDQALVEGWLDVFADWAAHDRPYAMPFCRQSHAARLDLPMPTMTTTHLVATVGDQVVGAAEIDLPGADNTSTALIDAAVHSRLRRTGFGRRLFEAALQVAREHSRSTVICETSERYDEIGPGRRFMETYGALRAQEEAMSVLDLTGLSTDRVESLHRAAADQASGYAVEQYVGVIDDEATCAGISALESTLSTDAPLGQLDWERENWDATRVRDTYSVMTGRGLRMYTTIARSIDSGRVVAETVLVRLPTVHHWAQQWATVVDPGHRGHRLGMLVKMANLRLLAAHEPTVRRIETYNAADNRHMLAVNEAMGFRRAERCWGWQLKLAEG